MSMMISLKCSLFCKAAVYNLWPRKLFDHDVSNAWPAGLRLVASEIACNIIFQ